MISVGAGEGAITRPEHFQGTLEQGAKSTMAHMGLGEEL